MNKLVYGIVVLVIIANLTHAATEITQCGNYGSGSYYLTKDLHNDGTLTECLAFNFNYVEIDKTVTLDCRGHTIDTPSPTNLLANGVTAYGLSQFTVKNCNINAAYALTSVTTPSRKPTTVLISNSNLLGSPYAIFGGRWSAKSQIRNVNADALTSTFRTYISPKALRLYDTPGVKIIDSVFPDSSVELVGTSTNKVEKFTQ